MQHIADSKIGTIQSNPNVKYPMVRLPRECSELIGQRAQIYKTEHEGRPAFLVVPYSKDTVQLITKLKSKVSKLSLETHIETRLSALESQINELKSLLILNESARIHKIKKEADSNGPAEIRTQDLRRVKATS
jgi:hypothetical protein